MQGQGCPQTPYTGQFADETEEEDTAVSVVVCTDKVSQFAELVAESWETGLPARGRRSLDPSFIAYMSVRMVHLIWSIQHGVYMHFNLQIRV